MWKILIRITLLFIVGCASVPTNGNDNTVSNNDDIGGSLPSIVVRDYLFTGLTIGTVLGIIGIGLGFGKLGIAVVGGSVAGILLRTTILTYLSNTYFAIAVALIVLGSVILLIAGILIKNKAIKEMIISIQNIKRWTEEYGVDKHELHDLMNNIQSKKTKKEVQKIKTDLKLKGKL
jgi:hypothetical protein